MQFKKYFIIPISILLLFKLCGCCNSNAQLPNPSQSSNEDITRAITSPQPSLDSNCEADQTGVDLNLDKGATYWDGFPYPKDTEHKYLHGDGMILLPKEQALEDYDAMWTILEENCPVLSELGKMDFVDLDEIKVKYRDKIHSYREDGMIVQSAFYSVVRDCLGKLQGAGHISVVTPNLYRLYTITSEVIYEDYKKGLYSENVYSQQKRIDSILHHPSVEDFYKRSESFELVSASQSMPAEEAQHEDVINYIATKTIEEVPYVQIKTFHASSFEGDNMIINILQNFFEENKDAANIIIDIRGNGGGSDHIWIEGILNPLLNEEVSVEYAVRVKAGDYNKFIWDDKETPYFSSNQTTLDALKKKIPNVDAYDFTSLDQFYIYLKEFMPSENIVNYTGKVWVIVDKHVYSSSDSFAAFCKKTGFATLVGTQTGGNGLGTIPLVAPLPNSGLLIRYECSSGYNDDGSCNAIVGTTPDIEIEPNQDALGVCLDIIFNP